MLWMHDAWCILRKDIHVSRPVDADFPRQMQIFSGGVARSERALVVPRSIETPAVGWKSGMYHGMGKHGRLQNSKSTYIYIWYIILYILYVYIYIFWRWTILDTPISIILVYEHLMAASGDDSGYSLPYFLLALANGSFGPWTWGYAVIYICSEDWPCERERKGSFTGLVWGWQDSGSSENWSI